MSTTALYKALLEANVSEETAERAVEGLVHAGEAATKTDLIELRADVIELRDEMKNAATKADLAELEVRLVKWNIATAIAVAGVIIAAIRFM